MTYLLELKKYLEHFSGAEINNRSLSQPPHIAVRLTQVWCKKKDRLNPNKGIYRYLVLASMLCML